MTTTEAQGNNLARMEALLEDAGGSLGDAVRQYTGTSLRQLAWRLNLGRRDVNQCLVGTGGRQYLHVRRALEAELGLPQYSLDTLIEESRG